MKLTCSICGKPFEYEDGFFAATRPGMTLSPPPTLSASAIIPGRITRKGKSIFGTAAISGVRRAAVIESAAIARWTTASRARGTAGSSASWSATPTLCLTIQIGPRRWT